MSFSRKFGDWEEIVEVVDGHKSAVYFNSRTGETQLERPASFAPSPPETPATAASLPKPSRGDSTLSGTSSSRLPNPAPRYSDTNPYDEDFEEVVDEDFGDFRGLGGADPVPSTLDTSAPHTDLNDAWLHEDTFGLRSAHAPPPPPPAAPAAPVAPADPDPEPPAGLPSPSRAAATPSDTPRRGSSPSAAGVGRTSSTRASGMLRVPSYAHSNADVTISSQVRGGSSITGEPSQQDGFGSARRPAVARASPSTGTVGGPGASQQNGRASLTGTRPPPSRDASNISLGAGVRPTRSGAKGRPPPSREASGASLLDTPGVVPARRTSATNSHAARPPPSPEPSYPFSAEPSHTDSIVRDLLFDLLGEQSRASFTPSVAPRGSNGTPEPYQHYNYHHHPAAPAPPAAQAQAIAEARVDRLVDQIVSGMAPRASHVSHTPVRQGTPPAVESPSPLSGPEASKTTMGPEESYFVGHLMEQLLAEMSQRSMTAPPHHGQPTQAPAPTPATAMGQRLSRQGSDRFGAAALAAHGAGGARSATPEPFTPRRPVDEIRRDLTHALAAELSRPRDVGHGAEGVGGWTPSVAPTTEPSAAVSLVLRELLESLALEPSHASLFPEHSGLSMPRSPKPAPKAPSRRTSHTSTAAGPGPAPAAERSHGSLASRHSSKRLLGPESSRPRLESETSALGTEPSGAAAASLRAIPEGRPASAKTLASSHSSRALPSTTNGRIDAETSTSELSGGHGAAPPGAAPAPGWTRFLIPHPVRPGEHLEIWCDARTGATTVGQPGNVAGEGSMEGSAPLGVKSSASGKSLVGATSSLGMGDMPSLRSDQSVSDMKLGSPSASPMKNLSSSEAMAGGISDLELAAAEANGRARPGRTTQRRLQMDKAGEGQGGGARPVPNPLPVWDVGVAEQMYGISLSVNYAIPTRPNSQQGPRDPNQISLTERTPGHSSRPMSASAARYGQPGSVGYPPGRPGTALPGYPPHPLYPEADLFNRPNTAPVGHVSLRPQSPGNPNWQWQGGRTGDLRGAGLPGAGKAASSSSASLQRAVAVYTSANKFLARSIRNWKASSPKKQRNPGSPMGAHEEERALRGLPEEHAFEFGSGHEPVPWSAPNTRPNSGRPGYRGVATHQPQQHGHTYPYAAGGQRPMSAGGPSYGLSGVREERGSPTDQPPPPQYNTWGFK